MKRGAVEPKHLSLGVAELLETAGEVGPQAPAEAEGRRQEPGEALSATRRRLLRQEMDPQMVLVRLLEDARWVQGRARLEVREAEKPADRLSLLKFFWAVRTELVKLLQGLGVLPRELFFDAEGESDFEHLSTEVAETISGLLSGRIEPNPPAHSDHAP